MLEKGKLAMFCYRCAQAAKGTACTVSGVCGQTHTGVYSKETEVMKNENANCLRINASWQY